MVQEREKKIRLWFEMWLTKQDLGIDDIFAEDVVYTESWSPQYRGRQRVKHWFHEWNRRGKVIVWDIKQFFHKEDQTVVEWYFKNKMDNGTIEEFGCNRKHYDLYEHGDTPEFREEQSKWF